MRRNGYQVWLERRTGLYYGVRLEEGRMAAMTAAMASPPTAFELPGLEYGPLCEPPPKRSNMRWRLVRLSFH